LKVKPEVIKAPRAKSAKQLFVEEFKLNSDLKGNIALGEAEKEWEALPEDEREPYNGLHHKMKDVVDAFKKFAKDIKDESLKSGVENTMKALRNDAAKRWHELKNNTPSQTDDISDISESESESEGEEESTNSQN